MEYRSLVQDALSTIATILMDQNKHVIFLFYN